MRLGAHTSVSGGKYKALNRGNKLGCETIQVFVRNVRSWKSNPLKEKDIKEFLSQREKLKNEIWPVISHNSYLINLASNDQEILNKSYDAMVDEMIKVDQLNIEFENMHPGVIPERDKDKITKQEALKKIAQNISKLITETPKSKCRILLETTAGHGEGLGHKFHHIKTIIDGVSDKKRIGVCFDTAHSFAAGYDFSTKKKYDAMWAEFDDIIGLEYLFAFHLNDTNKECGSRVDRHEHVGEGRIGKEAFKLLVNDERFKELPGILETPKGEDMYARNLKLLKSLRE
ncbi:MAG: deoxyribonuclease IV [Candidatus Lokiarchaeota archaeon]|nr:deoxyribonuclease IV [Candidatus Lokiarchaeota archaeon]MBD3342037.1 deoxyribonuclease IV [Candidatus Lokiarchaeota archaeon]